MLKLKLLQSHKIKVKRKCILIYFYLCLGKGQSHTFLHIAIIMFFHQFSPPQKNEYHAWRFILCKHERLKWPDKKGCSHLQQRTYFNVTSFKLSSQMHINAVIHSQVSWNSMRTIMCIEIRIFNWKPQEIMKPKQSLYKMIHPFTSFILTQKQRANTLDYEPNLALCTFSSNKSWHISIL